VNYQENQQKNNKETNNHMKYIIFLLILASCTLKELEIAEDILEGEAKTIDKVIQDVRGIPHQQGVLMIDLYKF